MAGVPTWAGMVPESIDLLLRCGIPVRFCYQVGSDQNCEAGQAAPQIDKGMEPGLEESDCHQDESSDGSASSERRTEGKSS